MLGEMRTAALLAKGVANDSSAVPAHTVLGMATINGAKALDMDDEIGSLTIGKQADIVAIDLDSIETQPMYSPISQIVYSCNRNQVTDVWVAGKQLLKERELTTIDETVVIETTKLWQDKIKNR